MCTTAQSTLINVKVECIYLATSLRLCKVKQSAERSFRAHRFARYTLCCNEVFHLFEKAENSLDRKPPKTSSMFPFLLEPRPCKRSTLFECLNSNLNNLRLLSNRSFFLHFFDLYSSNCSLISFKTCAAAVNGI